MKFSLTIKSRITLWYLLILTVALCLLSIVTYVVLSRTVHARIYAPVSPYFTGVKIENSVGIPASRDFVPLTTYTVGEDEVDRIKTETQSIIQLNSPFGWLPLDQKGFITSELLGAQAVNVYYRQSEAEPGTLEIMVILQSLSEAKDVMSLFAQILLYATPATIILAGIFGFLLIRRMLHPIDAMAQAARRIDSQDLKWRIPVKGSDELGKLAVVFNQTFEKLQQAFDWERGSAADASHELRTPLAIIKGEATLALRKQRNEGDYRRALDVISAETARLSVVVNRLLLSAQMDSGKEGLVLKRTNVKELLIEIAGDVEVLCQEKLIHFSLDAPDSLMVKADRARLRDLLLNLVDNATKYTSSGGNISVSLISKESYACIMIKDTGVGIAPEHIPHIFERFYRVDESINGTGLGLAICQRIAELHGGKIEVESKIGAGSKFTVLLPLCNRE